MSESWNMNALDILGLISNLWHRVGEAEQRAEVAETALAELKKDEDVYTNSLTDGSSDSE